LLKLTKSNGKWTGILIISFFTTLIIILIYRYTTNPQKQLKVKNKIKGYLLGALFYTNNIKVILKNFLRLSRAISIYFINSLLTLIIAIIPVTLIISQLISWYDKRPLLLGEESNLTLRIEEIIDLSNYPELIEIDEIRILEGPYIFSEENLLVWKFRALKKGKYNIPFAVGRDTIKKEIAISYKNTPVSPLRTKRIFSLFSTTEKLIPEDLPIKEIEIAYPENEIFIGKFLINWWLIFILGIIIFLPLLAYIFKIEI
jgi:hypothetical protein